MTTIIEVGEAALELLRAGDERNDLRRRHRRAMREHDWPRQGEEPEVDAIESERKAASARVKKARAKLNRIARAVERERQRSGGR